METPCRTARGAGAQWKASAKRALADYGAAEVVLWCRHQQRIAAGVPASTRLGQGHFEESLVCKVPGASARWPRR